MCKPMFFQHAVDIGTFESFVPRIRELGLDIIPTYIGFKYNPTVLSGLRSTEDAFDDIRILSWGSTRITTTKDFSISTIPCSFLTHGCIVDTLGSRKGDFTLGLCFIVGSKRRRGFSFHIHLTKSLDFYRTKGRGNSIFFEKQIRLVNVSSGTHVVSEHFHLDIPLFIRWNFILSAQLDGTSGCLFPGSIMFQWSTWIGDSCIQCIHVFSDQGCFRCMGWVVKHATQFFFGLYHVSCSGSVDGLRESR